MSDAVVIRTCMRDRIRDVLVARILDGTYAAGMQLKELPLAREFNVSQAPIREALRELEASGLVASERYRGTRVRGADLQEMRESYELRTMLEVRAVELGVPYPQAILDELARCLQEMTAALARNDPKHYTDEALRFHRQLVQASGNRTFLNLWDSLHWEVRGRVALGRIADKGAGLKPFIGLHKAVLTALRAQDVPAATDNLRAIFTRVAAVFEADHSAK
jgi:DNA-binding GntR family transcriptional regulator